MYTLKGFAMISSLVDNTPGVIAPIGELSPISKTYAKEKTIFRAAGSGGCTLMVFTSTQDGQYAEPDGVFATNVLAPLNWINAEAQAGSFNSSVSGFEQQFLNRWGSTIQLTGTGQMVRTGSAWFPEYIEFSFTGGEPNTSRVWFADEAFKSQYDDFEIVVMKPLNNWDLFHDTYLNVKERVDAITLTQTLEKYETLRNDYPETYFLNNEFFWVDKVNRTLMVEVDFPVLIYGAAGNNVDTIKNAIIEEILANSAYNREEWAVIFPDLFTSTEFVMVPLWNNFAIPNMVLSNGVHSPVVDRAEAIETLLKVVKGLDYDAQYIEGAWQVVPTTYRSLSMAVIGSPNNRGGITKFNRQFVDYLAVSSTHPDFQRISQRTQRFIMMLVELLIAAESLTPSSSVPRGVTRLTRDGVVYASQSFENVQYHVVTQYSLNDVSLGFDNYLVGGSGSFIFGTEGQLVNN